MIKISNLKSQISKIVTFTKSTYIFFFFSGLAFTIFILNSSVLAQEATPQTSSSPVNEEKVQELKEKLATKVAELRESQKRGFYGHIEALSKTTLTLVTAEGEVRVKLNDDTVIKDSTNKDLQVTDLKNTQTVSVLGLYDEEVHQAKVILVKSTPVVSTGIVESTDKKEATITVKNSAGDLIIYDYEKTTSADEYSQEDKKMAKSGHSRIDTDDRLIVWGTLSEDDQNRFTALRILRLPAKLFSNTADIKGDSTDSTASASPKSSISATASPSSKPTASPRVTPRTSPRSSPEE